MTENITRKLGRYALLDKLGAGSMGVVYKAYDETLDRYVALKTMADDMHDQPELRKRFDREARLAAKLNHPNIITVFDVGETDDQSYIAMELLEGTDLKGIMNSGVRILLAQKLDWMLQLCEALSFAHKEGIIHRDIKPGNIRIRPTSKVVLMDFGIARTAVSQITKAGVILGTPEYMSPEQVFAYNFDHRADIFCLGIVCYELLTGEHPFRSPNLSKTIHRILNETPRPPKELDPQIPSALSDFVMKAMEKDAGKRYQSCEEMLAELKRMKDERKDEG